MVKFPRILAPSELVVISGANIPTLLTIYRRLHGCLSDSGGGPNPDLLSSSPNLNQD